MTPTKAIMFLCLFSPTLAAQHSARPISEDVCAEKNSQGGNVCMNGVFDKTAGTCTGLGNVPCYVPSCQNNNIARSAGIEDCELSSTKIKLVPHHVNANSLGTSPVTDYLRQSQIMENMRGWTDVFKSKFSNFPTSLLDRNGFIPRVRIAGGHDVVFECHKGGEGGVCDAFVFIYKCPPCRFADGGNLPLTLLSDDWEPYACDVKFQLDHTVPTHMHDVVVYHKQYPQNTLLTVTPSSMLELSWFASSEATSNCADYGTQVECETELPGECGWDSVLKRCERTLCPKVKKQLNGDFKPRGPWQPKCKVCVDDEREMYLPKLAP
eukprot:TRINITY_DN7077_c1_g1_i1.p1 TRINITY_DN7077_c1_g1~~TRINITY_DN7077_c1_g1_i1.p1  ORF type:complete len:323 (+),score=53.96 TRINITY_DN7077_c1_g1_i1:69-1037(+)